MTIIKMRDLFTGDSIPNYLLKDCEIRNFILILFVLLVTSGCATTQERVYKLNDRYDNSLSTEIPGNIEQAKAVVRDAAKEMKFIERKYGSSEVKTKDDNFMLITNNRLKSGIISFLSVPMIASPSNLGVFLEYKAASNTTKVTVTEELVLFSLKSRRADLIKLIREKASKSDLKN